MGSVCAFDAALIFSNRANLLEFRFVDFDLVDDGHS